LQLRTDASLQRKRVLLRKLFSTVVDPKKLSLNLEFNISDEDGNKLGDRDSQYLYQFRELMVQEIIPYPTESLLNYQFMNKDLPLFSPNQPILNTSEPENYWMNTPLQNNK